MKLYKLTDQDWYTRRHCWNQTLWGPGVTNRVMTREEIVKLNSNYRSFCAGDEKEWPRRTNSYASKIISEDILCSPAWIHAYVCLEAAVAFNHLHADIENPVLWECEFKGSIKFDKDINEKVGVKELTTIKIIDIEPDLAKLLCPSISSAPHRRPTPPTRHALELAIAGGTISPEYKIYVTAWTKYAEFKQQYEASL